MYSVDKREFGGTQQDLGVAAPRRYRQQLLFLHVFFSWLARYSCQHAFLFFHGRHRHAIFWHRHFRASFYGGTVSLGVLLSFFLGLLFSFRLALFVFLQRLGLQIIDAHLDLFRRGRAVEYQAINLFDSRLRGGLLSYTPRQQFTLLLHKVAVHEEQTLQGHVGCEALLGSHVGTGKIEQLQILIQLVAAHSSIHRAASH